MSKTVATWVQPSLALTKPPSFLSPQVGCEEEQLCADFPELDLSQLDASDFDSATCFGELQWCPESSETEPSQYSPEDSELLQVYPLEHATPCSAIPLSAAESLVLPCTTFSCTCSCREVSSRHLPLLLDLYLILAALAPLRACVITSGKLQLGRAAFSIHPHRNPAPLWVREGSKSSLPYGVSLNSHLYPVRQAPLFPILQRKELRLREVKSCAQGSLLYLLSRELDSNPVSPPLEPGLYNYGDTILGTTHIY